MTVFEGSRYEKCTIYELENKYHLSNREPLKMKDFGDNIIHVVKEGDRLDLLAYYYWGNPNLYFIICDWNDIYDPLKHKLEPGSALTLPSYENIIGEGII